MALNTNYITEKNKLYSSKAWVTLAYINIADATEEMRFACNVSGDIIWNGYRWRGFPVQVGVMREDRQEIPQIEMRVCNINNVPEGYAETYDGLVSSDVTLYDVNTNRLTEVTDIRSIKIEITDSRFDRLWAYFKLGVCPNPLNIEDPVEKLHKNFCRFDFPHSVDARCPYTGEEFEVCDRTLANC